MPLDQIEDEFDAGSKDLKLIVSSNAWLIANHDERNLKMGAYLFRFCDPGKINVYWFYIYKSKSVDISIGVK